MKIAKDYLISKDIRPSQQRLAIINYLMSHRTHPTADDIYEGLHPSMPTLSKTTVYNTLKLFEEKKAVQVLNIDEKQTRYDACMDPHAHLKCERCGKVFDIGVEKMPQLSKADCEAFSISNTQIYLQGICPLCKSQEK